MTPPAPAPTPAPAPAPGPGAASATSSWYQDEEALLRVARADRRRHAPPHIDGYDTLHELRRGGQGVVYTSVQLSTKRPVAIKVLTAGALATPAQIARFEREAEIAAGLRHPHVVRIYDRGITPEGWPYLVMEYVEGRGLDEHLSQLGSPTDPAVTRRIVALMASISDAVHHAHQRGVIHRDLKPGNIRVDSAGEPRVLDFGLAKSARGEVSLGVSATGQFLGSLPWASPEQLSGTDGADTRSDVYALGVILCQALTGQFPYDVKGSLSAVMDNIRSAQPAVGPAGAALDDDLRTIVLKCLAKEPERRYQDEGEVAEDLRAWLQGEPIRARRESAWHAMRRTARRFRAVAIVSAAAGLLLAGASIFTALAAREARRQEKAATSQRERSEATVEFISGVIRGADPNKPTGGRDTKIGDLLDGAAARIDTDYANQPELGAHMHEVLGETYTKVGQYDAALAQFQAALKVYTPRQKPGVLDPDFVRTRAHEGELLGYLGHQDQALPILREVEAIQAAHLPQSDEGLQATRNDIAVALRQTGQAAEAEKMYRLLIASRGPTVDWMMLNEHVNLGSALMDLGRYDEAESTLREAFEKGTEVLGPTAQITITAGSNLATLLLDQSKPAEAAAILRRLLAGTEANRGEDDPNNTTLMHNLAKALHDSGDVAAARDMGERVLAIRTRIMGDTHPWTLATKGNLAAVLSDQGEHDRALAMCREVYEAQKSKNGEKSQATLIAFNNLARATHRAGQHAQALALFQDLLAKAGPPGNALPPGHFLLAVFQTAYARCLTDAGRAPEAEATLRGAFTVLHDKFGDSHRHTKAAAGALAAALEAQGKAADAAPFRVISPAKP